MADEKNERDEEQQPKDETDEEFRFPSEDFQTSSEPDDASDDQGSDFDLSGASEDNAEDEDDFGNLPPLSDFESSDSTGGDEGSGGKDEDDFGGLPPLSDIQVDTPQPQEGAPKKEGAAPSGGEEPAEFDSGAAFDTPGSDSDLDTPMPGDLDTPRGEEQTAFQDLQADSDFSPETPEIGPGPDTDLETPMFDSAFGGGEDLTPPQTSSTDAPTQAMETPMFGDEGGAAGGGGSGDEFGFDEGAFGQASGGGFGDQGTPVPDMSPDTGFPGGATPPPTPPPAAEETAGKKKKAKAGGGSTLTRVGVPVLIALICLGAGIAVGSMFLGGADTSEIEALQLENQRLQGELNRRQQAEQSVGAETAGKNVQELEEERVALLEQVGNLQDQVGTLENQIGEAQQRLELVQQDLNEKNNDFVQTQQDFEELQNQLSIERARQEGLQSEIERFQRLVGELEDANQRRMVTRDSLLHAIDRLAVNVREGNPLTPRKYSREDRIRRVEELRDQVENSNWVSAQLLDEYTNLFLDELEIGQKREYFFAKLPLESRIGNVEEVWVEAVMNGNWSVFFRSLDGKKVGIYQNVAPPGAPPRYEFRQFLDNDTEDMVESEIIAARPPDWQEKVQKIAERQLATDDSTSLQRWYESL